MRRTTDWQQEAIRLLTAKPKLEAEELDQLEEAVKREAGISSEKPASWPALTDTHLKAGNKFAPVTVLGSIGPLRNIDRLAAEQPPLQFAINGVTLIFGANGSGKSGYCRIAKKICHCLHEVTLRGNVFEPASADPREVTLTFRVNGEKSRSVVWDDRTRRPPNSAESRFSTVMPPACTSMLSATSSFCRLNWRC